jgi:glycosyltransferase involved in cell wall biosynthesis
VSGPVASERRNVLMLTYDFPPCRAPGAAVRTAKFVRYLPEFGWRPTVLCRADRPDAAVRSDGVVAVPAPISDRLSYQAAAWVWAACASRVARRLLLGGRFDVLYASGPPFPHVLAAARLSRACSIPLVVDFRDAWSLDPFEGGAWPKRIAKRALCRWAYPTFERRIFGTAEAIVSNTPSMAAAYGPRVRERGAVHALVPNGFDGADFGATDGRRTVDDPITFLHCGRFGGIAGRSADTLLSALRRAADTGRRVRLRCLGDASPTLERGVRRHGVTDLVELAPPIAYDDAIAEIRRADVLVLFQAGGRGPVTPVAGKTFEYVRSGRPVLGIVPRGDNHALVEQHATIHRLVSPEDPAAVAAAMCELADGHPWPTSEPGPGFAMYERRTLTARLAELFDDARTRRGAEVFA